MIEAGTLVIGLPEMQSKPDGLRKLSEDELAVFRAETGRDMDALVEVVISVNGIDEESLKRQNFQLTLNNISTGTATLVKQAVNESGKGIVMDEDTPMELI